MSISGTSSNRRLANPTPPTPQGRRRHLPGSIVSRSAAIVSCLPNICCREDNDTTRPYSTSSFSILVSSLYF
ncbi:hypothetical protein E2C01_085875 [Portunus trituberculatus]|uniref:Uncharacterized protein n=1 Tax=Portunus trituberculatus TaxID=210409 RepID=A0A5B7IZA3_PORTR|nr:hypothetical protein [Portunus trituberculatus]